MIDNGASWMAEVLLIRGAATAAVAPVKVSRRNEDVWQSCDDVLRPDERRKMFGRLVAVWPDRGKLSGRD